MGKISYSKYLDPLSKNSHAKANQLNYPMLSRRRRWKKKEDWRKCCGGILERLMSGKLVGPAIRTIYRPLFWPSNFSRSRTFQIAKEATADY
jgi:hypothetical protein